MKKLKLLSAVFILIIINVGCSKVKETKDSLDCLNKLVKFSDDSDDMTCSELTAALNSLENSCSAYFDEDDEATFALLKEACED